jgi:hypothetical protein
MTEGPLGKAASFGAAAGRTLSAHHGISSAIIGKCSKQLVRIVAGGRMMGLMI